MAEYRNHNYYSVDEINKNKKEPQELMQLDDVYKVSTVKKSKRKSVVRKNERLLAYREITIIAICICCAFILAAIISKFVMQHTTVDGVSMSYTLENGDVLIIDKLTYRFTSPKRFDIVVFPVNDDDYYIKRVIGLPGDTVQIIDGIIYINGEELDENFGYEKIIWYGIAQDPITLADDEYFVMGDNRNKSVDSREASIGPIKKDKIIGKAIFTMWPIRSFGKIDSTQNSKINISTDVER